MHIIVIPLDERPVNTHIPAQVASLSGASLSLPPQSALPHFRQPANLDALNTWLRTQYEDHPSSSLVVCTDTLVFGGIIPARITPDTVLSAFNRLTVLRQIKAQQPDARIIATSLVMRASDSYSNQEEPVYWATYGRELHSLGADLHRCLELDLQGELADSAFLTTIADDVLEDYAGRRLRNHMINLAVLDLVHEGVISSLAITADDTAYYSAGSAEQYWIGHWRRALPSLHGVLMYPGADEVGATMTARALVGNEQPPVVRVHCADDEGMLRIPSYENVPLSTSVESQIRACQAQPLAASPDTEHDEADIELVIHAPGPINDDWWGSTPVADDAARHAAQASATLVRDLLAAGKKVALADVRYTNGADPLIVEDLLADGSFWKLSAYGGWNTAGNTIGAVIATAVAECIGRRHGTLNTHARDCALWTRLLDDYLYQTRIRSAYFERSGGQTAVIDDDAHLAALEDEVSTTMREFIDARVALGAPAVSLNRAFLPWRRPFEVGICLDDEPAISAGAPVPAP